MAGAYGEILRHYSQVVSEIAGHGGEWTRYLLEKYGNQTIPYPKWHAQIKQAIEPFHTQESIACMVSLSFIKQ